MKRIFNIFIMLFILVVLSTSVFADQKLDAVGKKYLRSANMHKAGKRYDKAISFYLKVLEKKPNHIEAAMRLGDIYYSEKKDFEKSYKYFSLAINSIDKEISELKKLQEEKPKKKKKYQKKIDKLLKEKANIKKYLTSSWVKIFNKGATQVKDEKYTEALKLFNHLKEIAPDSVKTLKMIGLCYIKLDSLDKAINCLKNVLAKKEDYKTRAQLADLYFRLKQYDKSAQEYEKLIKLDPKIPDNYYNLCLVYNNLEDYDNALKNIDKYIELKPDDKEGYALGFETARRKNSKDYKLQIKYYKKYADLDNKNPQTLQYIFTLLYQDKQYLEALKYGELWYKINPKKDVAEMVAACAFKAKKNDIFKKYNKLAKQK